jgi:hypothetical protein
VSTTCHSTDSETGQNYEAESISPHERLTATLRILAAGRSYEDLKYTTLISPQALSYIIPETCDAIYRVLGHDYLIKYTAKNVIYLFYFIYFIQLYFFLHI